MKDIIAYIIESKKEPKEGKKYKADDGKMWKVEEFEWINSGDFAEEGHQYIIDEYNDGDYGNIPDGYYDEFEGYLVGCSMGSKKKAFLWDEDSGELYTFGRY